MKSNWLWFLLLLIFSCTDREERNRKQEAPAEVPAKDRPMIKAPEFNADSAFYFVKKQVDFGPRVPNTKAHEQCAAFLIATFKKYNLIVDVQEGEVKAFNGDVLRIKNIMASVNPEIQPRVLITAHWDTRPFADQDTERQSQPIDGANDGASGVGVILELARVLSTEKPGIGVDLLLFDAEDYGQPEGTMYAQQKDSYCLGSQFWAKNKKPDYQPQYAINLDMVGAKNAKFTMEGTSMQNAPTVVRKVWDTANKIGYSSYFVYRETEPITDDHLYINYLAKIPAIDIIEYDESTPSNFSSTWHTHRDKLDVIDKSTLKAVGQTLLQVIFNEK